MRVKTIHILWFADLLLNVISLASASVVAEVKLLHYTANKNDKCDKVIIFGNECDPYFKVCFGYEGNATNCRQTQPSHNTNTLNADDFHPNIFTHELSNWQGSVVVVFDVFDDNTFIHDRHLAQLHFNYHVASLPYDSGRKILTGANGVSLTVEVVLKCKANYYGSQCTKLCYNTGHGHCDNQGHLQCDTGFMGEKCQYQDECTLNPCKNNGTCAHHMIGPGRVCHCSHGYTGSSCQTNIDECSSDPCSKGFICHDKIDGYVCVEKITQDATTKLVTTPKHTSVSHKTSHRTTKTSRTHSTLTTTATNSITTRAMTTMHSKRSNTSTISLSTTIPSAAFFSETSSTEPTTNIARKTASTYTESSLSTNGVTTMSVNNTHRTGMTTTPQKPTQMDTTTKPTVKNTTVKPYSTRTTRTSPHGYNTRSQTTVPSSHEHNTTLQSTVLPTSTIGHNTTLQSTVLPTSTNGHNTTLQSTVLPTSSNGHNTTLQSTVLPTSSNGHNTTLQSTVLPTSTNGHNTTLQSTVLPTSTNGHNTTLQSTVLPTSTNAHNTTLQSTVLPTSTNAHNTTLQSTVMPTSTNGQNTTLQSTVLPTSSNGHNTTLQSTVLPTSTNGHNTTLQSTVMPTSTNGHTTLQSTVLRTSTKGHNTTLQSTVLHTSTKGHNTTLQSTVLHTSTKGHNTTLQSTLLPTSTNGRNMTLQTTVPPTVHTILSTLEPTKTPKPTASSTLSTKTSLITKSNKMPNTTMEVITTEGNPNTTMEVITTEGNVVFSTKERLTRSTSSKTNSTYSATQQAYMSSPISSSNNHPIQGKSSTKSFMYTTRAATVTQRKQVGLSTISTSSAVCQSTLFVTGDVSMKLAKVLSAIKESMISADSKYHMNTRMLSVHLLGHSVEHGQQQQPVTKVLYSVTYGGHYLSCDQISAVIGRSHNDSKLFGSELSNYGMKPYTGDIISITSTTTKSWIESHVALVASVIGVAVVIIAVITVGVIIRKRRSTPKYVRYLDDDVLSTPRKNPILTDEIEDGEKDENGTIYIDNPVYESTS